MLKNVCYNLFMKNVDDIKWNSSNINEFYDYLNGFKVDNKVEWQRNIVNTNYDVLAIPAKTLRDISKKIYKGDYISFLNVMPTKYYESQVITAYVISLIKDYKIQIKYIDKLAPYIDSWAVVDALKFSISNNEEEYFNYAKKLINSSLPFARRIGIRVLFSYTNNDKYLNQIFKILDSLKNEEHYYVNMVAAWLLCELFIINRDKTISYFDKHNTNKFIINKSISKCRDSYRVSKEDKELLLKYKIK